MLNNEHEELIQKKADNELTAEEERQFENLLASDPVFKKTWDHNRQMEEALTALPDIPVDPGKIAQIQAIPKIFAPVKTTSLFQNPLVRMAAAFLGGIFTAVLALQLSVGTFSDDPFLRGTFVKPESFTLSASEALTAKVQIFNRGEKPKIGLIAESPDSCLIQIKYDRHSYRINGYSAPEDSKPFDYFAEPGLVNVHCGQKGALVIKLQKITKQLNPEPIRISFSRNGENFNQNFNF